ncbi:putative condensin complex subunit 2/barren [Plasmopara halstedii]
METTGVETKSDLESDIEQYEMTDDEDEKEEKTEHSLNSKKRVTSKRKRSISQNDKEEVARRRRRRRSLAYQQRRRSLTSGEKKSSTISGTGGLSATPARNKQYISEMYSTIIKMSSENKINVKNSWSLHLIDHMEDILDSSKRSGDTVDDTYNFQKASCTLDASIKIYSYRVDDTWNSSYKILENLSRTEQKHGTDDEMEVKRKVGRKTTKTHARTIEKNLNNINLKNYEMECEADPLFHKMSQSFDEGGAKGMLLANLSVYDGCKILLNSSDVSYVTRKPIYETTAKSETNLKKKVRNENEKCDQNNVQSDQTTENEQRKQCQGQDLEVEDDTTEAELNTDFGANDRINLSIFGDLSCIQQNVQDLQVCPPLCRMYDQLDELYGDEARHKLGVQNEFLLKTPVKGRRQTLDKRDAVTRNLARIMEGAKEDEVEVEQVQHDISVDLCDDNGEYDDDDGQDSIEDNVIEIDSPSDNIEIENETKVIDLVACDDEESVQDDSTEASSPLNQQVSLISNAADFFRAKVNKNIPENYDNHLFSQMIESALFRSATMENEDEDGKNDYSYFDVKLLRNWAGPGHWKFPAVRKVQMKQHIKEETDHHGLEVDEDGLVIKSELLDSSDQVRKGTSIGMDKKVAILVDFFGESPDLSRLKTPKSTSSLEISKGNLKRQMENAVDLVLPVDAHIQLDLFFRHFMKEKTRYFRKRSTGLDSAHREGIKKETFKFGDNRDDLAIDQDQEMPFTYDGGGFEGEYDDEDESTTEVDGYGTEAMYSVEGLVQADRVVEKIGVHYERFAKRVDVKKLKGTIWEDLEKRIVGNREENVEKNNERDNDASEGNSRKRLLENEENNRIETNFSSMVESVANKVPSNVTVSFYFICVLHLANEKGLELVGQTNLCNFQIRKE